MSWNTNTVGVNWFKILNTKIDKLKSDNEKLKIKNNRLTRRLKKYEGRDYYWNNGKYYYIGGE